jgi:hypothetical protein
MSLAHTPLDPATLSEGARRALAGGAPQKMMAARGLVALPRPGDLLTVLYVLGQDADPAVAAAAQKSAADLPEKLLAPGLADSTVDPRVLDQFAARALGKPAAVEALLLNQRTADETVQSLTPKLDERALEMVAQNEQRLIRRPEIIGALYMNIRTRMSTVDRAVELAVRHKLTVPGIPAWDDVVAAVLGSAQAALPPEELAAVAAANDAAFDVVSTFAIGEANVDDHLLEQLLSDDDEAAQRATSAEQEEKKVLITKLSIPAKIRLATLGNAFARATLIRDTNRQVAVAAAKSPGLTDNEVVKYSGNRGLSDEVIRIFASDKTWTRHYQIKQNLILNPKCPLALSMRMLPFLHEKDIQKIAKSKGIPNALATQAAKLAAARKGK